MKVVIVGGVAGGASAAARLRRLDEHAQIVMFERSGYVSYANCGLPYYVGGIITDKANLTLQTPQSFNDRFNVDARVLHEVTAIDRAHKTVRVRNLQTGDEFDESYDKLILSPGAKPTLPPIDGIGKTDVYVLRTVEDTFALRDAATQKDAKRALVVGGGFIGLEAAENLKELGLDVTLVEFAPHVMAPLDSDMAALVQASFAEHGVSILCNTAVMALKTESDATVVATLSNGSSVEADFVVMAAGVSPENSLAKDAELDLGVRGSISVNASMQTSDPDIYAVGDAVEVTHLVSGAQTVVPLAGPANRQGRIAADAICGLKSSYKGSQGTSVIKVFDKTAASCGLSAEAAAAAGIDADSVVLMPPSHASYYPGSSPLVFKLVFERNTWRIIGAQAFGAEGVEKRIDVVAVAQRAGLSALELKELDLAYAPPFSSAKDPVNMAGLMVENIALGLVEQFDMSELFLVAADESKTLLDTRTDGEWERGHIEGAVHIPVDELRGRMSELDVEKPVYVMCQSGLRSYVACRMLSQSGFNCKNLRGGYGFWSQVQEGQAAPAEVRDCGVEK